MKPPFLQRWKTKTPANGPPAAVQRDLYSAFLIMNTSRTLDGFNRAVCTKMFPRFIEVHDRTIEELRNGSAGVVPGMGIIRKSIRS